MADLREARLQYRLESRLEILSAGIEVLLDFPLTLSLHLWHVVPDCQLVRDLTSEGLTMVKKKGQANWVVRVAEGP